MRDLRPKSIGKSYCANKKMQGKCSLEGRCNRVRFAGGFCSDVFFNAKASKFISFRLMA